MIWAHLLGRIVPVRCGAEMHQKDGVNTCMRIRVQLPRLSRHALKC